MKKKICLIPGPFHLFMTTGVYYFFLLCQKYDIILVVDEKYKSEKSFEKVSKLAFKTFYLKSDKSIIARHIYIKNISRKILYKYKPSFIFQNNHVSFSQIYFFKYGRKVNSTNISFLVGASHNDPKKEIQILEVRQLTTLFHKFKKKIPLKALKSLLFFKKMIQYYSNYFIIPILNTGKPLLTPFDPYSFKAKKGNSRHSHYDYRIVYSEDELIAAESENTKKMVLLNNPIAEEYLNVQNTIYNYPLRNEEIISIFPSNVLYEYFLLENLKDSKNKFELLVNNWLDIIRILKNKYFRYKILIKLHPADSKSKIWDEIITKLQEENPDITLVPNTQDAIPIIISSEVVVSENSTVLWFAKYLEEKKNLISIDFFNLPFGDIYKNVPRINYYNDLEAFKCSLLDTAKGGKVSKAESLSQFLIRCE